MIVAESEGNTVRASGLDVVLDRPLPATLPAGQATAVFCVGTCFHRHQRVTEMTIAVNGMLHRPIAQRMPRLDRFRELHPTLKESEAPTASGDPQSSRDPELRSYRSGFWGVIPISPQSKPGELALTAEARLEDGTTARSALGTIAILDPPEPPAYECLPKARAHSLIAICLATYNPEIELFRTQVESIRAQTDRDWICLISDDCSTQEEFDAIVEVIAGDERFVLSRAGEHRSFYRNFERALAMVPAEAQLVTLCDHDDRWYANKLQALREAIGSAEMVYSDLRRVDTKGQVRAETLWQGRRNNHTNLASLLISNTIPGAACMFRRRVLERALPFPDGPGWDFHDHWLALVAMALGEVAYVDRPLYDYVQHPRAVLGRVASDDGSPPPREKSPGRLAIPPRRDMLRRWRSAYFSLYLQRVLLAQVLLARCEPELKAQKRRALRLLIDAGRKPLPFTWLTIRPMRATFGRNETLRLEETLVRGTLWRYLVALRSRGVERPSSSETAEDDARMPPVDPKTVGTRQRRWLGHR